MALAISVQYFVNSRARLRVKDGEQLMLTKQLQIQESSTVEPPLSWAVTST